MIVEVKADDNGELYIEIPPELLEEIGWSEGTDLIWTVDDDGAIGLRKKDDSSNEA